MKTVSMMFFLILFLAFSFRYFGIDWDQGHHLHPDERMIIMVADRLHLPKTLQEWATLTTPLSPLNPKFFAYGSFPIYLLKFASFLFSRDNYGGMLFVGRCLSILFELGTVILVFLIAKEIIAESGKRKAESKTREIKFLHASRFTLHALPLLAMFFYSICVLPIQSSHFFISDIPLTFLTTLTLYLSIKFINLGKIKNILNTKYLILNTLLGLSLGLSLATKITAILLTIPTSIALILLYLRLKKLKYLIFSTALIAVCMIVTFAITMPYAIIDFPTFKAHTLEQSRMRVDPFIFPFTLQYVNTTAYWYFIKNLVLWGMGLPLGILATMGTVYVLVLMFWKLIQGLKKRKLIPQQWEMFLILTVFFLIYFAFMGKSAVKFMRYLLPLYPLLCIFGAFFITDLWQKLKLITKIFIFLICFVVLIWPLSFVSIYANTHTRIAASLWMYEHIPRGAKIALEHWDDGLPLLLPNKNNTFQAVEFPLYGVDNKEKWEIMDQKLKTVDYIIIASNRLYVPLMRLTDCEKLPPDRCYPLTAKYYKNLFNGQLGFIKVAEFASYPSLSLITQLLNYSITFNDDSADESFTVYDHPKIMIFKKSSSRY